MRLIDADKLYPDCLTKYGRLAISQSQIANAPTVETSKEVNDYSKLNQGKVVPDVRDGWRYED